MYVNKMNMRITKKLTLQQLKEKIFIETGALPNDQHIVINGQQCNDPTQIVPLSQGTDVYVVISKSLKRDD